MQMRLFVPPALFFSVLVALLYACLFHLLQGRTLRELMRSFWVSVLGFGWGQVVGMVAGLPLPVLGQVHLVEGTAACWLALYIARRLNL
jgi:energy-coupling factor transporter transmembrane protein EcfT